MPSRKFQKVVQKQHLKYIAFFFFFFFCKVTQKTGGVRWITEYYEKIFAFHFSIRDMVAVSLKNLLKVPLYVQHQNPAATGDSSILLSQRKQQLLSVIQGHTDMWAETKTMIVGDFLGKQRNLQFGSVLVLRTQQHQAGIQQALSSVLSGNSSGRSQKLRPKGFQHLAAEQLDIWAKKVLVVDVFLCAEWNRHLHTFLVNKLDFTQAIFHWCNLLKDTAYDTCNID